MPTYPPPIQPDGHPDDDGRPEFFPDRTSVEHDGVVYEGLSVPEVTHSWGPEVARPPIPQFRCTAFKEDGERCTYDGVAGLPPNKAICRIHGGGQLNVLEYAKSQQDAAWLRLYGMTEQATDAMEALLGPGTGEAIRFAAAKEVLALNGVSSKHEIHVEVEVTDDAGKIVRERLDKLRRAQESQEARLRELESSSELEIEDADVVEESE